MLRSRLPKVVEASTLREQLTYGYSAYGEPDEAFTEENDPDNPGAKVDQTTDARNPYRCTDKRWNPASGKQQCKGFGDEHSDLKDV